MIISAHSLFYTKTHLRRRIGAGTYSLLIALTRNKHNRGLHELLQTNPQELVRIASMINKYVAKIVEESLSGKRLGPRIARGEEIVREH